MDNNFFDINMSDRLELYRVQGFDHMQLDEIEQGLASGVNVDVYADKKYMFLQMAEIRKGLEQNLDVTPYLDDGYDWFQMREIRRGIHDNVDVSVYLDKNLDYLIMREIRKGLLEGIDLKPYYEKGYYKSTLREIRHAFMDKIDIGKYVDEGYSSEQLEQIRLGLTSGIDINKYLNHLLSGSQMYEIRSGLEEGLDISPYNNMEFNWLQMREIRLGIKSGVDVSIYSNRLFSHTQMREIRLGLEDGLDVSEYASFMWSATDMQNRRIMLKDHGGIQSDLFNNSIEILSFEEHEVQKDLSDDKTSNMKEDIDTSSELPVNLFVEISSDGMAAYISVISDDNNVKISENAIMNALKSYGIRQGIKKEVIDILVSGTSLDGGNILIAEGKEPIDGEDGYFEYFFNSSIDLKPKINTDGSVNYDDVKLFEQVDEGETIAIYHPATNGIYGYTVIGKLIHPKKGVNLPRLKGKGFSVLDDGITYVSDFTGCIEMKNDYIEISSLYKVKGNLTAGHGNIKFDGDVFVTGDVGSRVNIEATGNVTINGNVDAAFIKAGKDVLIKSGVTARGICSIEADNNIHGKYFENVRLFAGNNIESNYLYNCNAVAMNSIIITGKKGSIVGGVTSAIYGIEASTIGNQSEVKTNFEIGSNEHFENKLRNWHIKSEEITHKIMVFREELNKIQMQRKMDSFKQNPVYQNIQTAILQLLNELEEIKKSREEFTDELAEKAPMIGLNVSRKAYAGCLISINKAKILLDHDMGAVTFKEVNDKIVPIPQH